MMVTFSVTVQELFAATVPPLKASDGVAPLAAVAVPPHWEVAPTVMFVMPLG